jgi:acetyl-CoA acetyltransferase
MSGSDWARVTDYEDIAGEVAIVGLGETAYTAASGRHTMEMGLEAIERALDDAGLKPGEVDGLMITGTRPGQPDPDAFRRYFGVSQDIWYSGNGGSFIQSATALYEAALAIRQKKARRIVNVFSIDWATQVKAQTGGPSGFHEREPMKANLEVIHGWIPQPVYFATIARRYFHEYGVGPESLGAIAVSSRKHANNHPDAVMKNKLLSLEAYLARAPFIDPFRIEDCCLISDGGAAFVITAADEAKDLRKRPAIVQGVGHATSKTSHYISQQPEFAATPAKYSAPAAFRMAGITPADVDVVTAYDPFTIVALMQIEDMGFCPKGEAGRFVAGDRLLNTSTRRRGGLPFNTHGGLLSHAYLLGIAHVVELVKQVRGEAPNQVQDAELAVFGGYNGAETSTLVLSR